MYCTAHLTNVICERAGASTRISPAVKSERENVKQEEEVAPITPQNERKLNTLVKNYFCNGLYKYIYIMFVNRASEEYLELVFNSARCSHSIHCSVTIRYMIRRKRGFPWKFEVGIQSSQCSVTF